MYILILILECILLGLLIVYYLNVPSRDEVNIAIKKGVIDERKDKWSKKCRLYTRINRNKEKIKNLKNDIVACKIEYYSLINKELDSYAKKDD